MSLVPVGPYQSVIITGVTAVVGVHVHFVIERGGQTAFCGHLVIEGCGHNVMWITPYRQDGRILLAVTDKGDIFLPFYRTTKLDLNKSRSSQ